MHKYSAVVNAIRRIVERWAITKRPLISDANSGDTTIYIQSTRRWQAGDQFLITNNIQDMENNLYVAAVPDQYTIQLTTPLKWNWPVAAGAQMIKTQGGQFVKGVYLGEPNVMPNLPAVTVNIKSSSSEFLTIRGTKERYELEISVFVNGTTLESGDLLLWHIIDDIQYGLKRNFYPLLNDYSTTTLLQNVTAGDLYISVGDSSLFIPQQEMIIEDTYNIDVLGVVAICDSTTVQLGVPTSFDFLASEAICIAPHRLPFNSWPNGVRFGLIEKGTLLKAATISYFIEEYEPQNDASYGDTQLT